MRPNRQRPTRPTPRAAARRALAALAALASLSLPPHAGAVVSRNASGPVSANAHDPAPASLLLVGYRPSLSRSARAAIHPPLGARSLQSFRRVPIDVVQPAPGQSLDDALAAYRSLPDVEFAEPNRLVHVQSNPNDPLFPEQWGLLNVGQNGGVPGFDANVSPVWAERGVGSSNVLVAVLDTGIDYLHPDLAANVWSNPGEIPGNGIDDDGNGIPDDVHGARWTNGDGSPSGGDPMDDNGHGTHVAGIVGAVGGNALGVAGVNWNVRLMALKFCSANGSGWTADAVAALDYAIARGARVSNNSWSGGEFSRAMLNMVESARAAGQLFCAAAGNDGIDNDSFARYPAGYDVGNVVSVASMERDGSRSWFSCFGRSSVDLAAPGGFVLSTVPDGRFEAFSGTSMAAPHVAGAAALLLSLHPDASPETLRRWLLDGARRLPDWRLLSASEGILDVAESLRVADLPAHAEPVLSFRASGATDSSAVLLEWVNPSHPDFRGVVVRRGSNSWPRLWSDGSPACEGSMQSFSDESLPRGERFFYSIWAVYGPDGDLSRSPGRFVSAMVGGETDDHFTELFDDFDVDLAFKSLLFVPDDGPNRYSAACSAISNFPSDPSGGVPLDLGSANPTPEISFGDSRSFPFFGLSYPSFFPSAHGYVSFGSPDGGDYPALFLHQALPRVSALFAKLDPASGSVSWKSFPDRAAITWQGVPCSGFDGPNDFQIELFFDGRIRISWLALDVRAAAIAGLSDGLGPPPGFLESDLSDLPRDPLGIFPRAPWRAAGGNGFPFVPAALDVALSNAAAAPLPWSASLSAPWLSLSASHGSIPPAASESLRVAPNSLADSLPLGSHFAELVVSNDSSGVARTRRIRLDVELPLCEALDSCKLPWISGGAARWFLQTNDSFDGVSAAASGLVGPNQSSWISTTVDGPGNLSFAWKVSSERTADVFSFADNDSSVAEISGDVDWQVFSHPVPAGTRVLRWSYRKDLAGDSAADRAWLDQVSFVRGHPFVHADDHAGNYGTAPSNFVHGANRGSGFGPWSFDVAGGGESRLSDSSAQGGPDVNSDNQLAFSLAGGTNGSTASAVRPFGSPLRPGDAFRVLLSPGLGPGIRGFLILAENQSALLDLRSDGDSGLSCSWAGGEPLFLSAVSSAAMQVSVSAAENQALELSIVRGDGFHANLLSGALAGPAAFVAFYDGNRPAAPSSPALFWNLLAVDRAGAPSIAVSGPGLVPIANGESTPSSGNGTDFGLSAIGQQALSRSFNVSNSGTMGLSPGTVFLDGPGAEAFGISLQPASPVAPGGSTPFAVSFNPPAAARYVATVVVPCDDPLQNPFSFAVAGIGSADGEAANAFDHAGFYPSPPAFSNGANRGSGFAPWSILAESGSVASLADSSTLGADLNSTNGFSFKFMGGPSGTYVNASRPFLSPLRSGDVFRVSLAYSWNAGARGVSLVSSEGSELFFVSFSGGDVLKCGWQGADHVVLSTGFVFGAVLDLAVQNLGGGRLAASVSRNDGFATSLVSAVLSGYPATAKFFNGGHSADSENYALFANDLVVERAGTPGIAVLAGDGSAIPDRDSSPALSDGTHFGGHAVGLGPVRRGFFVRNSGSGPLDLFGFSFAGPGASAFRVESPAPEPILPGQSAFFSVAFEPPSPGLHAAVITLSNNAPLHGSYSFSLAGSGRSGTDPSPADDHAGNYPAPAFFSHGANRGSGFLPWIIASSAGSVATLSSSSKGSGNINSQNGFSFMFVGGPAGTYVDAVRPLAEPLRSGDVLRVSFAYNWNGGARGLAFLAEDDSELLYLNFGNGDVFGHGWLGAPNSPLSSNYVSTAIVQVALADLGDRRLRASLSRNDGFLADLTSPPLPGPLAKIKFYNGGHSGYDPRFALFANRLAVDRIHAPPADSDSDGIPDWWEFSRFGDFTNASPSSPAAAPGLSVLDAWIADLDPSDPFALPPRPAFLPRLPSIDLPLEVAPSSTSRVYRLLASSNLLASPQSWIPLAPDVPGSGSNLLFSVSNASPARFFRVGVRLP